MILRQDALLDPRGGLAESVTGLLFAARLRNNPVGTPWLSFLGENEAEIGSDCSGLIRFERRPGERAGRA